MKNKVKLVLTTWLKEIRGEGKGNKEIRTKSTLMLKEEEEEGEGEKKITYFTCILIQVILPVSRFTSVRRIRRRRRRNRRKSR